MSAIDLSAPVGEPAGLVTSTSTEGQGFIHRNVTLVSIGEGKSHGGPERSMLVDPEFVLAEHLMGHGSEAPFAPQHYGVSVKPTTRRLLSLFEKMLNSS